MIIKYKNEYTSEITIVKKHILTILAVACACGLYCVFLPAALKAQDITVADITLLPDDPMPDTPPAFKKPWRIDCPDTLKQRKRMSYVFISQYIDAKGKRTSNKRPFGPEADLRKFITDLGEAPAVKAAMLNGKPSDSMSRIAVIFNPTSASLKGKDATPRTLAVAPVEISPKQFRALGSAKRNHVIPVTLQIDATGAITGYDLPPKSKYAVDYKTEIDAALAGWKFAPARVDGKPVAGKVETAFHLTTPEMRERLNSSMPIATHKAPPFYPYALKMSGVQGEVVVQFMVNKNGKVEDPVVIRSSHGGFEEAAIQAILKWKFKPGTKGGKPVATRMQQRLDFNLNK